MGEEEHNTSRAAKVLVVTASVGAGHNSAARAIVSSLQERAPDVEVPYLDLLPMTPWAFRTYYAGGYAFTVTRFPFFYGVGYALTNRPHRPGRGLGEWPRLRNERRAMKKFARYLVDSSPDLVVHTHFLAPPLMGRMIGRGELSAPQITVVTDNDTHRYWYAENVDHWFVPADSCAEHLRTRWGIPGDRITVSGIPVHPKWTRPVDRARALAEWNLPSDKRIVLISGGVEFTCGPIIRIARQVVDECEDAHVVVIGGHNKRLLGHVAELARTRPRLSSVSFTDRLQELLDVCSLMVTKAGGITTAECLARGTPMLLLRPVPGQEGHNAAYFEQQGAAVVARRGRDVAPEIRRLLADEEALRSLAENARRLYRPATETIVSEICRVLGRTPPAS